MDIMMKKFGHKILNKMKATKITVEAYIFKVTNEQICNERKWI